MSDGALLPSDLTERDVRLEVPLRMQVSAPSHSGKSYFCLALVKHRDTLFQEEFKKIIYCYDVRATLNPDWEEYQQKMLDACNSVQYVTGLPDVEMCKAGAGEHSLVSVIVTAVMLS